MSRILVAINPYQWLPIYGDDVVQSYRGSSRHERSTKLGPHVYGVAESAYQALLLSGSNQSMIVCGESGSGKTENAKKLMSYLAESTMDSKGNRSEINIEEQVLEANPILEAFGNAKTLLNNNSSRFGKFTKMLFEKADNASRGYHVVGAFIETYLLEKSRVIHQDSGERNYHVFYQLMSDGAKPIRDRLGLELLAPKMMHYTSQGTTTVDGISDDEWFQSTLDAMKVLEISPTEQDETFRTIAGVLHLGNVKFTAEDPDDTMADSRIDPKTVASVKTCARLFGCDESELSKRLTTQSIRVQNQVLHKPLSIQKARMNRDAMAKSMYEGLFGWIVKRINRVLFRNSSAGAGSDDLKWVGILDVFGFESFENNSFEQFCINFCNERLQQYFNTYIIKSEQEEYKREAIFWAHIDVPDNQDTIELIQGRNGIVALLDSACLMPKGTPEIFTQSIFHYHRKHAKVSQARVMRGGKAQPGMRRGSLTVINGFAVKHYAGIVVYNASDFLMKNSDSTHIDTVALFMKSSSTVTKEIFDSSPFDDINGGGRGRGRERAGSISMKFKSLGTTFVQSLTALMKTLKTTDPYFVRCINPNDKKQKLTFDDEYTKPQLRCGGLIEALRILKCGFPTRVRYEDVYERYGSILNPEPPNLNKRDFCEAILWAFDLGLGDYQMGLTKVFFRPGKQEFLERLLHTTSEELGAGLIEKIRKFLVKKRIMRVKGAIRAYVKINRRLRRMRAISKLQKCVGLLSVYGKTLQRSLFEIKYHSSVIAVQAYVKAAYMVKRGQLTQDMARRVQKWWRLRKPNKELRRVIQERIDAKRQNMSADEIARRHYLSGIVAQLARELRTWMEAILGESVRGEFFTSLQDGRLLCELIQKIEPKFDLSVHQNARSGSFYARDNVSSFVTACGKFGVPEVERFLPNDLIVRENLKAVVNCLLSLSRRAFQVKGIEPPPSVKYELERGFNLSQVIDKIEQDEEKAPPVSRRQRWSRHGSVVINNDMGVNPALIGRHGGPQSVLEAYMQPHTGFDGQTPGGPTPGNPEEFKSDSKLAAIASLLDQREEWKGKDPMEVIQEMLNERNKLMEKNKELEDDVNKLSVDKQNQESQRAAEAVRERASAVKALKGKKGANWIDANHMFFFMTALSCKLTSKGPGRGIPTPELYKRAMAERVPFQFYKDWILKEIAKPIKK